MEIGRYFSDTATINLYTNIGDAAPARTISIAPSGPPGFQPVLVSNVLYSAELFTKITIDGFKGYYGIDNIVYAPVPEASTYAMMLTGLGIVGYFARRRRM